MLTPGKGRHPEHPTGGKRPKGEDCEDSKHRPQHGRRRPRGCEHEVKQQAPSLAVL